jgi:hypothetical protein
MISLTRAFAYVRDLSMHPIWLFRLQAVVNSMVVVHTGGRRIAIGQVHRHRLTLRNCEPAIRSDDGAPDPSPPVQLVRRDTGSGQVSV